MTEAAFGIPEAALLPTDLRVLIADDVCLNLIVLTHTLLRFCCKSWRVTQTEVSDDAVRLFLT